MTIKSIRYTTTRVLTPMIPQVMIVLFALSPIAPSMAADPVPVWSDRKSDSDKWTFVSEHSDEFNAGEVDRKKWNIDTEDFGVWSWEPDNIVQNQGSMHLRMVHQEHRRGNQTLYYTSGMARNDKTITYGYFEARVKGCSRYPGASPATEHTAAKAVDSHSKGRGFQGRSSNPAISITFLISKPFVSRVNLENSSHKPQHDDRINAP